MHLFQENSLFIVQLCACLLDLILYVPSTIFQLNKDGSSWVEPVLSYDKCVLLKDHNAVPPVRLEPTAFWSRVKHSTTEPLRSLVQHCKRLHESIKSKRFHKTFVLIFVHCRRTVKWLIFNIVWLGVVV